MPVLFSSNRPFNNHLFVARLTASNLIFRIKRTGTRFEGQVPPRCFHAGLDAVGDELALKNGNCPDHGSERRDKGSIDRMKLEVSRQSESFPCRCIISCLSPGFLFPRVYPGSRCVYESCSSQLGTPDCSGMVCGEVWRPDGAARTGLAPYSSPADDADFGANRFRKNAGGISHLY